MSCAQLVYGSETMSHCSYALVTEPEREPEQVVDLAEVQGHGHNRP